MDADNALCDLVKFWQKYDPGLATSICVHPDDRKFFDNNPSLIAQSVRTTSGEMTPRFHLKLQPVPYMGNLIGDLPRADIFLLMTNPSVERDGEDYVDNENPAFKKALQENLSGHRQTCLAWDEDDVVGETGWTRYYRRVLRATLRDQPDREQLSEDLERRLAILELIPYYSPPDTPCIEKVLRANLPSVQKMKRAAKHLEAAAQGGKVHLMVRWQNGCERWEVSEDGKNIVHAPVLGGLTERERKILLEWLRSEK